MDGNFPIIQRRKKDTFSKESLNTPKGNSSDKGDKDSELKDLQNSLMQKVNIAQEEIKNDNKKINQLIEEIKDNKVLNRSVGISALKNAKKWSMSSTMFKIIALMSLLHIGRGILLGFNPMIAIGVLVFTLNASVWSIHKFVLPFLSRITLEFVQFSD